MNVADKAIEMHTIGGQCKRERISSISLSTLAPPIITSTTLRTTTTAAHTDECFYELQNYVLEGTALAVEANTTVDACKCACVDAERRYGAECQVSGDCATT